MIGYTILFATIVSLNLTGTVAAHDPQAGHDGHSHGRITFDAGQPGRIAKVTHRVNVTTHDGDGRMSFEPSTLSIQKGETIEFIVHNSGHLDHEFVVGSAIENASHAALMETVPDMKHLDPNAVGVASGKTERLVWTFSNPGEFEFACLIPGHYDAGMKGTVTVK